MRTSTNGIYAIYVTGKDDKGLILAAVIDGKIAGSDTEANVLTGTFDYDDAKKSYFVDATLEFQSTGSVVQGPTVNEGFSYKVEAQLPVNFTDVEYIPIHTTLGPVNAKFCKLIGLNQITKKE